MKKITIIFMSVLMIFASCSMDTSYDDTNESNEKTNTEIVEDDDSEKEKPLNEDDSKKETEDESSKEENDSENNDVVTEPTENNNDESSNEEPKEDDSENNTEEPKEDDSENEIVENKTWCDITEDTLILGLNYFVCIDDSQTKLKPSSNVESKAKANTFLVRGYASRYVEIRVKYDNGKLNFSSVNDSYTIVDVTMEDSNVNITIEWK